MTDFYSCIFVSTASKSGDNWCYNVYGVWDSNEPLDYICSLRQNHFGGEIRRYREKSGGKCIDKYRSLKDAMFIIHDELHIEPHLTVDDNDEIKRGFI